MYIHSNIDVRTGRLQWVLNGPGDAPLAPRREIADVNFATKLAFWDWLFGTAYLPRPPRPTKPAAYGLHDGDFPRGYLRQVAHAFRSARGRPRRSVTEL